MMGRIVKTLVNSSQTAGYKSIQWDATNNSGQPISAGIYIYTIQAGEFRSTKKMLLLK
jgi:flagellar hook assembly protein FlgD